MGQKNEDKCDARYCRDDAVVSIRMRVDGVNERVLLCDKHWTLHLDDKAVKLRNGREFPPLIWPPEAQSVIINKPPVVG